MRKFTSAWALVGFLGLIVVSCGSSDSAPAETSNGADAGAAGVPGAADAEGGSAGSDVNAAGGSATIGGGSEAGAGGTSGAEASLLGLQVTFLGPGTSHGSDNEAELVGLITDRTGTAPKRVQAVDASSELTNDDLFGADVLIVDNVLRPYSTGEAALVAAWVASGHGLIVLNGFSDDSSRAASLAASYGVTYQGDFAAGTAPVYVTAFSAQPVVRGVSSLYFLGGYAMTSTDETAVAFASIGTASVGLALTHGEGRVVLWGDDWIDLSQEVNRVDANGQYPTQVFWSNALRWASGRD